MDFITPTSTRHYNEGPEDGLGKCMAAQKRSLRNMKLAPICFSPNLHHKNSGILLDSNTNNNSMEKITVCDNQKRALENAYSFKNCNFQVKFRE